MIKKVFKLFILLVITQKIMAEEAKPDLQDPLKAKLAQYRIPTDIGVNSKYRNVTVLIYAAIKGDKEFVELLLKAGANKRLSSNPKFNHDAKYWVNELLKYPTNEIKVCGGGPCRRIPKSVFREILQLVS